MKRIVILLAIISLGLKTFAQVKPADTLVIKIGQASKVIFAIQDKKDLETLKKYNFQSLLDDMISKLEKKDTTKLVQPSSLYLKDTTKVVSVDTVKTNGSEGQSWRSEKRKRWGSRRTYHSFNFDIGTNNYLTGNGQFPDQTNALYSVKPWGSWYVGINSIRKTHVAGKFFIEWGFGVSWYNFKFQNYQTTITKNANDVSFVLDDRNFNYLKSKLTATYLNISFIPVFDFGRGGRKTTIFDGSRMDFSSRGNHSSSFRIGVGPYLGYRIDSYSKLLYKDASGNEQVDRHHDAYYLNNLRYGMRFQFGFDDLDFFFNYDMNKMFVADKGPDLNAFSFGVTF
jgi:hypothetical protein